MAYQSFEDLEVWQRGCRLSVEILLQFRSCKEFTLKNQIQRAGLSIPSNIAEGSERGSVLYIARKLDLIPKAVFEKMVAESREISSTLEGLRRSLLSALAETKSAPRAPRKT